MIRFDRAIESGASLNGVAEGLSNYVAERPLIKPSRRENPSSGTPAIVCRLGGSFLAVPVQWVWGLRADFRPARRAVRFYQLPSIDLRGIAYCRYQEVNVAMVVVRRRRNFTSRWAALAFAVAGRGWGRNIDFGDAGTESTEGVGIRYLIARQLGMYVGADSAPGPGEHTYYLQVGSAWR